MKKQSDNLRHMLGDINFESYQSIKADAQELKKQLPNRDKIRGRGRRKGEKITLVEIRIKALALLRECSATSVPPPPELIEIFDQIIGEKPTTPTSEFRKKQFAAAADAELAGVRLCDHTNEKHKKWDIVYETDVAEIARAAGADRTSVRAWRLTEKYGRAVVEAIARKVGEKLE